MPILRYKFGQERGIVKENAGFDDSIFRDQYVQALRLTMPLFAIKRVKPLNAWLSAGIEEKEKHRV